MASDSLPTTADPGQASPPPPSAEGTDLVSTIIPVHNRAGLLQEAVASVLAQTHRPIEILIINDGSEDDTAAVAEELARRSPDPIRVIHQRNAGPGAARQRGLEVAEGRFIQFLDSDDLLLPGKFAAQVAALHRQPHCQICYGPSFEENHALPTVQRRGPMRGTGQPRPYLFPELLIERWWTTSSPLYRRELLDRIGPWMPWINEEDWEYDARAGATGAPLAWVSEPVSVRRIHLPVGHLSDGGCEDPLKLAHRALAQESLFRCARQAGVSRNAPEMAHFARAAFLLSRQCGLAGADQASRRLFHLAQQASSRRRRIAPDFLLYGVMARLVGWNKAARLSTGLRQRLRQFLGR
ncbi:MAG: glycosyltransferase family 2 protein [Cyanobium sp.]